MTSNKLSSGLTTLDAALDGGFLPNSLIMIIGATGVGKTQLGMHFSQAGLQAEGQRGAIVDLSSRGDSQNHSNYMQRMFEAPLTVAGVHGQPVRDMFDGERPADLFNFLGYSGRRVLRSQMDVDQWHAWQSEMNRRTPELFRFVYSHLVHGTRRFIVDGIEPLGRSDDSLQLDLLELIYHRMLRTEHDWLAREVLREGYLKNAARVQQQAYDHRQSSAMVLVTTKQTMLEQLMTEPLSDGDLAAGANTVILMGRILADGKMSRGLYVAKHRGSFAASHTLRFDIDDSGIVFE
ncbi:MAG: ATPase domain-containing protein [Pirellulaceae bacterium]